MGTSEQVGWEGDKKRKGTSQEQKDERAVTPWQQRCEFPREPQAGTGIFLGRREVCSALLVALSNGWESKPGSLPSLWPKAGFSHQTLA